MRKGGFFGGLVVLLGALCLLSAPGWAAVSCTCSNPGDLQKCINQNFGKIWTTFTVTGPATCYENLTIVQDGTQLVADTAKGSVTISAQNSNQPVISVVSTGWAGINGFTIEGGAYGIDLDLGHGYIINNTIKNNSLAGIHVGGAYAFIGAQSPTDAAPLPNTITGNPIGILVTAHSGASIVGNTIKSGSVAGIVLDSLSQADIAGNTIDSFVNAISLSENSVIRLSDRPWLPIFGPLNTTDADAKNSGAAILCASGGVVSGYEGGLLGATAYSGDATCINNLMTNSSPLVGNWNVTSHSNNMKSPPTQVDFYAVGTGWDNSGGSVWRWTATPTTLTIKSSKHTMQGSLTWTGNNKVKWVFTGGSFTSGTSGWMVFERE
ncbi:MAG TPA: right-handed parallel beta-helix repeat-containing protein [Syntrophobacteraceae bacterium]|nr:right-handed parallel beta-helix repeat-containing protein [Syntrophobacteraceae bacterium]